jgi:threonine dehydrogenase-like Zn-dependent dehydrogenase
MNCIELDADWDPRPEYELSDRERESDFAQRGSEIYRNPSLRVAERPRPEPAADEVLIRVRYAGICGSDLSMVTEDSEGYMHYSAYIDLPSIPGHEFSGVVAETGSDVTEFDSGDLVTSEVTEYCGSCGMCRRSLFLQCDRFDEIGFTRPGAFAEYVAVPEKLVWSLDPLRRAYDDEDSLLRAGATVEPTTISFFGLYVRAGGIRPGETVVFHGGGPIGLTGVALAVAGGARAVLVEPIETRRTLARRLGCDHVLAPDDDVRGTILDLTGGRGADVHVEAAGAPAETYETIQETLGPDCAILQLGIGSDEPRIDLRGLQSKQAQLLGSQGHTGNRTYPLVIQAIANRAIEPEPMITAEYSLSDIDTAVEAAVERTEGKILLAP